MSLEQPGRISSPISRPDNSLDIYLVNETSSWHAGSAAVMKNIKRKLINAGHRIAFETARPAPMDYTLIEQCDAVVLNGEGALQEEEKFWHDGRARKLLEGLAHAKNLGKPAYLINCVWYHMEPHWGDLLGSLDGLCVREIQSQWEMHRYQGVTPKMYPDLSYSCPLESTEVLDAYRNRYVVGSFYHRYMRAGDQFDHTHEMFSDAVRLSLGGEAENQDGLGAKPVADWSTVVNNLRVAKLYITGQQHGVYAACKARIPFAVFRVHNHKIEGLFEWCGVDIPIAATRRELSQAITWAEDNCHVFEQLFARLESFSEWSGRL